MSGPRTGTVGGFGIAIGAWALLFALAMSAAVPQMDRLGLYYDEAFMAQQARDFVEPGREGLHPASVRSVRVFDRPFPTRNAAYLGSLKSQLLIPSLWLAGASPLVLRITTFATAWLALGLAMGWIARIASTRVALLTGLLVATDPGFYFLGQFEWGPFTTNLLCRSAGLFGLTIAWQATRPGARAVASALGGAALGQFEWGPFTTNLLCRSAGLLALTIAWQATRSGPRAVASALGGAALGLGVYSRADFALIIAALAAAAVLGHRALVVQAWRTRRRDVLIAAAAMAVCSAPMWIAAWQVLGTAGTLSDRGDLAFRARVLWSVLDGSQFHRLMQTGGLFELAQTVSAPAGWFGFALAASLVALAFELVAASRRDARAAARDPRRFVWLVTIGLTAAMLALPGAVRAHHLLNVMPFVQLSVAFAFDLAWQRASSTRTGRWARVGVALALAILVVGNLRVIALTRSEIALTGGRGRWTSGLYELADRLAVEPGASAVSLDWGFHEPLLFLTDDVPLSEAIWPIRRLLTAGRPWIHEGDAGTRYLVHDAPYDLFGLGPLMLAAARAQPAGAVSIETFRDDRGDVAFHVVRIPRRHRLIYTGRFTIE